MAELSFPTNLSHRLLCRSSDETNPSPLDIEDSLLRSEESRPFEWRLQLDGLWKFPRSKSWVRLGVFNMNDGLALLSFHSSAYLSCSIYRLYDVIRSNNVNELTIWLTESVAHHPLRFFRLLHGALRSNGWPGHPRGTQGDEHQWRCESTDRFSQQNICKHGDSDSITIILYTIFHEIYNPTR